ARLAHVAGHGVGLLGEIALAAGEYDGRMCFQQLLGCFLGRRRQAERRNILRPHKAPPLECECPPSILNPCRKETGTQLPLHPSHSRASQPVSGSDCSKLRVASADRFPPTPSGTIPCPICTSR